MDGYVKVYRRLMHSAPWQDTNPATFKLFMYCLLNASHNEHEIMRGGERIALIPGQFIYSRTEWAQKLDVPASTIRNLFDKLKNWDIVSDIRTDKGLPSVYQVNNWSKYQDEDNYEDTKQTSKRTKVGQRLDTTKKDKKEKKDITIPPNPPRGPEVCFKLSESELAVFSQRMPKVDVFVAYRFVCENAPASVHSSGAYFAKRLETMRAEGILPMKRAEFVGFKITS